jgi:transcriptional regulator of arginine metabolism
MNKSYRQGQIVKLIRAKNLHTQEDLARELRSIGIPATQVTLSRDIRELGIVKTAFGYVTAGDAQSSGPDIGAVVREFALDVRVAQNLLVLRTAPGHANSVAVALDKVNWPEIAGTIAGDDTVLVIAPDSKIAQALSERFLSFLK